MTSLGDSTQIRLIAEQIADATITRWTSTHPAENKVEIPSPLKWAGGIIAALFTAGITALCFWIVTTLSEMQVTVARIDERQQLGANDQQGRFNEVDRRITRLEALHAREAERGEP